MWTLYPQNQCPWAVCLSSPHTRASLTLGQLACGLPSTPPIPPIHMHACHLQCCRVHKVQATYKCKDNYNWYLIRWDKPYHKPHHDSWEPYYAVRMPM